MIMAAAMKEGYNLIWLFLLLASAGVLKHAGIQIPYFAFFAHDSGIRTSEPPKNMLLAMTIAAAPNVEGIAKEVHVANDAVRHSLRLQ